MSERQTGVQIKSVNDQPHLELLGDTNLTEALGLISFAEIWVRMDLVKALQEAPAVPQKEEER